MASCRSIKRLRNWEEEEQGKKSAEVHVILLFWVHHRFSFYAISCYDDDKWSSSQGNSLRIQFPFPTSLARQFLGSCSGLLCYEFYSKPDFLSNDTGTKCVVWEASSCNKFQLIPKPSSMNIPCDCSSSLDECVPDVTIDASGLWFDSQSGECKFVSFTQNSHRNRGDVLLHFHHVSLHAQVYSVKNNAWKELTYPRSKELTYTRSEEEEESVYREIVPNGGCGVCVNGVCYWPAQCIDDSSYILSFNFVTEEYSSFHVPQMNDTSNAYELVDLDGSLGILMYPRPRVSYDEAPDWKGIIRLMVYSSSSSSSSSLWSRVDGLDDVTVVGFHKPLWVGKRNGRYSFLLLGPQGVLLDYDYSRKVFNQIGETRKLMKHKQAYAESFAYEPKNNADIWHSSSFHQLQLHKRFAVYASHQDY